MIRHEIRVHPSTANLPREQQLAWHIARFAANCGAIDEEVAEMIACRIVDNASVALAAINRKPVAAARAMALAHPRRAGASLYGLRYAIAKGRSLSANTLILYALSGVCGVMLGVAFTIRDMPGT